MFIAENSEKHRKLKLTLSPPSSSPKQFQVKALGLIIYVYFCVRLQQNKQNSMLPIVYYVYF